MLNPSIEHMLLFHDDPLIIEASRCATVREENTLLHTLMLLSTVGYSEIPVLDSKGRLTGLIRFPNVIQGIKDDTQYCWDELQKRKVCEVMQDNPDAVVAPCDLEDVLHGLVDHNFICVVNPEGIFEGLITRKSILTRLNFLAHEMGRFYDIEAKEDVISRIS